MNLKGIACGFVVSVLAATAAYTFIGNRDFAFAPNESESHSARSGIAGADVIHGLGKPLLRSQDVATRAELTKTLRDAATFRHSGSTRPGPREPQAFEILSAAYARETDAGVKVEIINAVAEFNVPEAAELLNRAAEDVDSVVRTAAREAKTRRELRLQLARR